MNAKAPKIDTRRFSQLLAQLKRLVPHYTPEWQASDEKDPSVALLKIFAHMAEDVIERLNQTPQKNFVAFLNMLGIKLLPARPARVPLTFKLAEGTETEIFIPHRTRAVAQIPDAPGELPFETESNLLATPSALKAVYSVDPAADAIYRPPPGFLDRNLPAPAQISYKINTFSPASSNTFQLDHDSGLEAGDYLRIIQGDHVEHVVISEIDGTIVKITGQLSRGYSPGTLVEKNNKFFLFENVNLQQHILYLGHSDLFSVKSASCFTLEIKHLPGTPAVLQSLNSSWEYWGDAEGGEEEAWRKFYVKTDGSRDLSQNGKIKLIKGEGEIKEREINGISNRWIRCKLIKPPPPELPELDRITFRVESTGKPVYADQAFHNDTPLDVALPFFPFGSLPRMYDKFYLASKEVFSKKDANVTIDIRLESFDIVATPAAVIPEDKNQIKVFGRGTRGRLVEVEFDPAEQIAPKWTDHGFPPHTLLAAPDNKAGTEGSPSVVSATNYLGVFVKADNGQLMERFYDGTEWKWLDHGMPEKENNGDPVKFDPSAAVVNDQVINVFVVTKAGNLHCLTRDLRTNQTAKAMEWTKCNDPKTEGQLNASPFAAQHETGVKVFVWDQSGNLREFENHKLATVYSGPVDQSAIHSRPFAICYLNNHGNEEEGKIFAKVFAKDAQGDLWELDAQPKNHKDEGKHSIWQKLTQVDGSINVASSPHGVVQRPENPMENEGKHIFVRDHDNVLWECTDHGWIPHRLQGKSKFRHSPFVVATPIDNSDPPCYSLYVYCGSDDNSIVEGRGSQKILHSGKLSEVSRVRVTLDDQDLEVDKAYERLEIVIKDSGEIVYTCQIEAYDGKTKVATLAEDLQQAQFSEQLEYSYEIKTGHKGEVRNVDDKKIKLDKELALTNGGVYVGLMIKILRDEKEYTSRKIVEYNGDKKEATLESSWDPQKKPTKGDRYQIDNLKGTVQDANALITLDQAASDKDGGYTGCIVEIIGGKAKGRVFKTVGYDGKSKKLKVDLRRDFDNLPGQGDGYRVLKKLWTWDEYKYEVESMTDRFSWEYWDGKGWVLFKKEHGFKDGTYDFLKDGKIEFKLPKDIEPTEVSGQENIWIRVRIVGGDDGSETFSAETVKVTDKKSITKLVPTKTPIRPPRIIELTISYKLTKGQLPHKCLTFNNLDYRDQTAACRMPDKYFLPFLGLEDRQKTIYFGFEKKIKGAPIKIFLDAREIAFTDKRKPRMVWRYRNEDGWPPVSIKDETEALIKPENLELLLPEDFSALSRFGRHLYWIKGTLAEGSYDDDELPVLRGIYPNTTWAFQVETVLDEILGSSSGDEKQVFRFSNVPVREGEEIRLREALTGEERDELMDRFGKDVIRERTDESGQLEYWVSWKEVVTFADSGVDSRHYKLDRATGELQFGDGKNGMIPAAGADNIRAFFYQAGGGFAGNVGAGQIQNLASAIAGVDAVVNPAPAGGGSDAATLEDMLEIGPAKIGHRNRAVTLQDFEWLAKEASREVAKVRCLANTNNKKQREAGWVSVYIVPDSQDATPRPSLELLRAVPRYLQSRCAGTIAAQNHIFVGAPEYVEVNVSVDIYVKSMDVTSQTERLVRQRLEKFFHPLRGGPAGKGWEFGRNIAASDVFVLLEKTAGVDHVEKLNFTYNGKTSTEMVEVEADSLVASGTHAINMRLAARA